MKQRFCKRYTRILSGTIGCLAATAPLFAQPTITSVYKTNAPVLDGVINASEYGAGLSVLFDGDANPGRFAAGSVKDSASFYDHSYTMYTSHTADTAYFAFDVRDQFIDDRYGAAFQNDCVELFFDADHVTNDFVPYRGVYNFNREGFQLLGAVDYQKISQAGGTIANSDWNFVRNYTATGYTMEFAVPLVLMDKVDGAGYASVVTGDHIGFNVATDDNDRYTNNQDAQTSLMLIDPAKRQNYVFGEDGWKVDLYLSPNAAQETDIALGKTVTLHSAGDDASRFTGTSVGFGGADPSTLTDGVYLPKNTGWQDGTVWWDGNANPGNYIDIDLAGTFTISSLNVQADDNDAYFLDYLGVDNLWHRAWDVPNYDFEPYGMQTRPNPNNDADRYLLANPITAKALRFYGDPNDSDHLFAVSEIQAFGVAAVPEPGTVAFGLITAIGLLGLITRKRRPA